ncbi:unnamed protein product [Adineta steineri]|uniref:Uncharacterized protein n=2 Tax=Adineta steineri TaxID=433720 RepID=A0A813S6P1_9BILA|nr:unnamed protein product [Adineta steineri]CAF0790831.1 unnamed protein product [Adineta steineri]CAF3508318.1 unnamed protein product [Adineta steineri]
MPSEDISTSPVILSKRIKSHKHRTNNPSQSVDKSLSDDFRISRPLTARNRSLSKSPKIPPKTEFVQFKRCQSQPRDVLPPSLKLERQSTNMTYQPRLPTFHTVAHEQEQKRTSDFRRRQIYALNHLMRNLEQEKFRQFCELNKLGTKYNNNDDTNKEILT